MAAHRSILVLMGAPAQGTTSSGVQSTGRGFPLHEAKDATCFLDAAQHPRTPHDAVPHAACEAGPIGVR
jgi:hypothetical protein